jgi:hypothetical protein
MTKAREIAELGQKLTVDASGNIDVNGSVTSNTLSVDTNITVGGTVDGRDVATDGTKLDGIEASADVTDTSNVTAAGALMDSELTDIAAVKALNQGVATTDDPTFTNTQLAAISETISDTAVDIFVYDTRKDSDGGAWRKRTQHTSWYNETLNTATRGSRKEFPAVAVIVADSTAAETYIYDGDDPDLPLWMSFDNSANSILRSHGTGMNLAMLNGKLMVGLAPNDAGLAEIDFLSDSAFRHTTSGSYTNKGSYKGNIAERNSGKGFDGVVANPIVNIFVNDVAMTVLPNAPIDAATGLPVPTIAVGTDGGLSVIKDDGTVVDITGQTNDINIVAFTPSGQLLTNEKYDNYIAVYNIPSSDISYTAWERYYKEGDVPTYLPPIGFGGDITDVTAVGEDGIASNASTKWLLQIAEDKQNPSGGLVNNITSSYNTGWMNGDIKLATLSDTDDTDVTGSELVTNGTFDSDVSGWTAYNAVISHDSGTIKVDDTGNAGANSNAYQQVTLEVGKTYTISVDVTSTTDSAYIAISTSFTSPSWYASDVGVGTYTHTFTAGATTQYIALCTNGTSVSNFDNISLRLAEEDRSVNGNGLQVFGTVTKTPVASGADLVAYSGFSSSNYLEQPYNSDLDFGTGDFCIMGWVKWNSAGSYGALAHINNGTALNSAGGGIGLISGGSSLTGYIDGTNSFVLQSQHSSGVWDHYVFMRQGSTVRGFVNGVETVTGTNSSDIALGSTQRTIVGGYWINGSISSGIRLALLRISATAPSPEQIKKIYEDEKVLFQENAQATLYGSSDAVTALAYDDSTELLHVGTSAGRSVFQGLRRVDNTTTAVGAAISASNGLVADE